MRTYGVQTYTVRKLMKYDLDFTMHELNSIGIREIECARMPITEKTVEILKKYEIQVPSVQLTYHKLKHHKNVVPFCKKLGIKYAVISVLPLWVRIPIIGLPFFKRGTEKLINQYQSEGIRICFHHHDYEMKTVNGKRIIDRILHSIDPALGLVIDTYWIKKVGQDPKDIYTRYQNQIVGIHLRDYHSNGYDTTIGKGEIDFKSFIPILKDDVYTVIEHNASDPLISIQEGLIYLEGLYETKTV